MQMKLLLGEAQPADWAARVPPQPFFDAIRVEAMAAEQPSGQGTLRQVLQTNRARVRPASPIVLRHQHGPFDLLLRHLWRLLR